jgi:hypothetical protein
MKRSLLPSTLVLSFTLAIVPPPAHAQYINVGWGDSPTNGAPFVQASNCLANSGVNTIVYSFTPPQDMHGVNGFVLDLKFEALDPLQCPDGPAGPNACTPDPLPPWWDFTPGTGCRAGAISASLDFYSEPWASSTQVTDAWNGMFQLYTSPYFLQTFQAGSPQRPITIGRWQVEGFAAPGDSVDLLAGHEYYVARVNVSNAKSAAGACAGCCTTVTALSQLQLSVGGQPTFIFSNSGYALWQGSSNTAACLTVPAHTSTWGSLKSRYR